MIGLIVLAIIFFIVGFVAIPPLKQSLEEKNKSCVVFCIVNMIGMWVLSIFALIRALVIGGIL